MNIGVIGRGFVGGSMERFLKEHSEHSVEAFDAADGDMEAGYRRVVEHSDIIYVAVPTPMDDSGKCYTGILDKSLKLINEMAEGQVLVFIKSTMSPGTSNGFKEKYKHIDIVTNPEFLTERNAYADLCAAKQHVLGGVPESLRDVVRQYHEDLWEDCQVIFVSNIEAELIKYLMNTYLSVKVSFANHIYRIAQALGIEYSSFIEAAIAADPRIEPTHWAVPGPDGQFGFGGKCLPKDLNGMMTLFKEQGVACPLLEAAWFYNLDIREDQDWKRIYGAQTDSI